MDSNDKQSPIRRVTKDKALGACANRGCTNDSYKRYHRGWQKWIFSSECKTCTSLKKNYGIHTGIRNQMMEEQENQCKICSSTVEFVQGKNLSTEHAVVDHDHETGAVRGILCGRCNTILGRAQDNTELLAKMIRYLDEA